MKRRTYIVKVDGQVVRASLTQYLLAFLYRKIRGWSSIYVIGSFCDV